MAITKNGAIKNAALLTLTVLSLAGCKPQHAADVVATVNGHPILRTDMDRAYNEQLGDAQNQTKPSPEQADSLRLGLLRELIDEEIIQQRAVKMNLTATPEEVDARVLEMKTPYTEEEFARRLAANHTTLDEIKHDLRRSLTQNKLLNKEIGSKITVSDADIQNYYNEHKAEFNNKDVTYHLAQILVTNSAPARPSAPGNLQGSKATNDVEARKKIQALKNRADSGEDFGVLAMNFSENQQNAASQGDMGTITETDLKSSAGPLYEVLSKLKPGQVTDIIPFPDPTDPTGRKAGGYAIFQLISRDPAGQHDVSEPQVQQHIRQGLRDVRSTLLKNAYFEVLRNQAKVENFYAEQIFKSDAR